MRDAPVQVIYLGQLAGRTAGVEHNSGTGHGLSPGDLEPRPSPVIDWSGYERTMVEDE